MTRIAETFARARAENRAALVVYLTAFDPAGARTASRACAPRPRRVRRASSSACRSPIPAPTAPTSRPRWCARSRRARPCAARSSWSPRLRQACAGADRAVFGYANPIARPGARALATAAAAPGPTACCWSTCPPEHAEFLRAPVRAAGLDWIGLVAPTTTRRGRQAVCAADERVRLRDHARGVTGAALRRRRARESRRRAHRRDRGLTPRCRSRRASGAHPGAGRRSWPGSPTGSWSAARWFEAGVDGVPALSARVEALRAATVERDAPR